MIDRRNRLPHRPAIVLLVGKAIESYKGCGVMVFTDCEAFLKMLTRMIDGFFIRHSTNTTEQWSKFDKPIADDVRNAVVYFRRMFLEKMIEYERQRGLGIFARADTMKRTMVKTSVLRRNSGNGNLTEV